jgi:hypothetical protein
MNPGRANKATTASFDQSNCLKNSSIPCIEHL